MTVKYEKCWANIRKASLAEESYQKACRWPNGGFMVIHLLRCWPNSNPELDQHLVSVGGLPIENWTSQAGTPFWHLESQTRIITPQGLKADDFSQSQFCCTDSALVCEKRR